MKKQEDTTNRLEEPDERPTTQEETEPRLGSGHVAVYRDFPEQAKKDKPSVQGRKEAAGQSTGHQ
jgi:hypothetical protein